MSDDLILELTSPSVVTITQDCSFEDFIAQFQTSCSKLLCIINGKQLHYYDKKAELPIGLKFEYKRKFKDRTAYYFRDVTNNTYCVFGREVALQFYPRLDEVDPSSSSLFSLASTASRAEAPSASNKRDYKVSKSDKVTKIDAPPRPKAIVVPVVTNKAKVTTANTANTRIVKTKCPSEIVIIDCGQRYIFPHANYNIEVHNHQVY